MNFWQIQHVRKKRTQVLVAIFCFLTLVAAMTAQSLWNNYSNFNTPESAPFIAVVFALVTFSVAFFNYLSFKTYGGSYVAESMGGEQINPLTPVYEHKQLFNIVEEIAISSRLPVPKVYLLPANEINAFAAGIDTDNAAIAVTQGCLNKLSRDELQAVIAHEFGHIQNQDMKLGMQLAAMIMGFFAVFYVGLRLLQFSSYGSSSKKGSDKKGGVQLVAIALLVSGLLGWFFGSILKAMVSREREYLADACSMQFTRHDGLVGALKKIQEQTQQDMPSTGAAYSHLYFNNGGFFSSIFATHPPIEKRIKALEKHTG